MLYCILAVLALFLLQVYGTALMFLPSIGIGGHVGPRDELPRKTGLVGRSERALLNFKENLPIFLTFALLSYLIAGTDQALALLGAKVFLIGRVGYVAAYLWGVPWVRSILFGVSAVGLVQMLVALL